MIKKIQIASSLLISCLMVACTTPGVDQNADKKRLQLASTYNVQLGVGYLERGNIIRSKEKLTKALDQDPQSAAAHYAMAYFLEQTGDPKNAEIYYQKAINLRTDVGASHNNYGAFLCRQDRFVEAQNQFLLAVSDKNYPSTAEAYENAGLCAVKAQDIPLAEGFFKRALQNDPRLSKSLIEMVQISYDAKDYKAAEEYLVRYRVITQPTPRSLWLGIQIARATGDKNAETSYALLLKNTYPDTDENRLLQELDKNQ